MKIYTLKRTQIIHASLQETWNFFSSPASLAKITPPQMGLNMKYRSGGEKMYPGQIIRYTLTIFPLIPMKWVTEITHVSELAYFVDEQRFGPYALWHHQHHFKEVPEGIEMTDEINYAIPFGFLGRLANWLFVERQVNAIFDFRFNVLQQFLIENGNLQKSA
jgi:ligand-binding SRPBCC domain-containing protein